MRKGLFFPVGEGAPDVKKRRASSRVRRRTAERVKIVLGESVLRVELQGAFEMLYGLPGLPQFGECGAEVGGRL